MARVKLMPGIESISGKVGKMVFRTINGKTYVHEAGGPVLPADASRQEKAAYRKRVVVEECVYLIQKEMQNTLEAIRQHKKIYDRVRRLYDRFSPKIKARTKLQKAIMSAYYEPVNDPKLDRENKVNGPLKV